ncbi:Ebony, partial [Operophtera brumata]
ETLSKELAAQFFKSFEGRNGYKLANFYGSTEVMGDVTYYVLEKAQQLDMFPTIPIGMPLDNCAVYLLDEEMNPARESEPGQVWVAGGNLASGYVGGQGAASFQDNPHAAHPDFGRLYRTGDFGTLEKGMILYAGRTDSQVKIRGHRVDLQEVDRAVAAVPGILAFVTIDQKARIAAHHVEAALKNSLTSYMIPQVIEIETVPLLVNGKVDHDSEISLEIDYAGVEPEALDKARVLFETVGEVLGRAARGALSITAGFYELGGNSLNSIYTITRLRDKGYYIEISEFLGAANLGEVLSSLTTSPDSEHHTRELFTPEPMKPEHKQLVTDMIVSSFYEKAELEQFVKHEIEVQDYAHLISAVWTPLLTAGLSVVLSDEISEFLGAANLGEVLSSLTTSPDSEHHTRELFTPEPMKPEHKQLVTDMIVSSFYEKAELEQFVKHEIEVQDYAHLISAVWTPLLTAGLSVQLGRDVLGFKTLLDYQINQYVDPNGNRIFGKASDDMRAIVCWKPVE